GGSLLADEKQATKGIGHRNRLLPLPGGDLTDLVEITRTDPQNDTLCGDFGFSGPLQKGLELTTRARTQKIEGGHFFAKLLVAADQHPGVGQTQLTDRLCQKRGFLYIRLNQKELQLWTEDFQGQARKSAARADVGQPTALNRDGRPGKHALAEVTVEYL